MAKWRKIYTSFYENEELGLLPLPVRYLLKGLYVWADDSGRFRANPKIIKAKIFPYDNLDDAQIANWTQILVKKNCIKLYEIAGEIYGCHPRWSKYNKPRKDRREATNLPSPLTTNRQPNDNQPTTKWQPNGNPDKIRIDKIRIDKKRNIKEKKKSLSFLKDIPESDLKEISEKYDCSPAQIKSKADDLFNYCEARGKRYKNYKAFLKNAVKKDFGERVPEKKTIVDEYNEEQARKNREKLAEMKRDLLKPMPQ